MINTLQDTALRKLVFQKLFDASDVRILIHVHPGHVPEGLSVQMFRARVSRSLHKEPGFIRKYLVWLYDVNQGATYPLSQWYDKFERTVKK